MSAYDHLAEWFEILNDDCKEQVESDILSFFENILNGAETSATEPAEPVETSATEDND